MDLANKEGGILVGTGDLSELALGWCTYNGDHMSMYGVNASVRRRWCATWWPTPPGRRKERDGRRRQG